MLSFWEKDSFIEYDYIIVGGGIVGLSTAACLLETQPNLNVLVLEQGLFPSGASTKNAGFACFGSLTEILADINKIGKEATLALVTQRWEGLQKLQKRLGVEAIGLENLGGYELLNTQNEQALKQLEEVNELLQPLFPEPVFSVVNAQITAFGFNPKEVTHLVFNRYEAQIHTGKMMKSLLAYVQAKGATILTGAKVTEVHSQANGATITVNTPNQSVQFLAKAVAICTNGFTKKLLPDTDVKPGRGQVLITEPIPQLKVKGTFHIDEGFFYFRNVGNRLLIGGGRNLDFEGETTDEFIVTENIINAIKERLDNIILPQQNYTVAHTWAGIMAFNEAKKPILTQYQPHIWIGTCLNGMGVAIGSALGENLAQKLLKNELFNV